MTRTILLGVTADTSLILMRGLPEFLARNGWRVHVASGPGPNNEAAAQSTAFSTHVISMARNPHPVRDLASLISWIRLLRRVRPDVVHVGTPKAGLLGTLAAFITRVPHRVYILRGLRYETSRGVQRRILRAMERVTMKLAHRVVAVSPSLRALAIDDNLTRAQKITVLGAGSSNGVDLERFRRKDHNATKRRNVRWPTRPDTPVFGFIGRLHEDKGLDLLYEAARSLHNQGVSFRLLIVGPLESDVNYPDLFHQAGIPAEFTGNVSDPLPYLELMDVLCLPTKREGFPNVVLEAAACAIPTIATQATGVVDAIIHQQTGLLTANRDPQEFATLMRSLATNIELRSTLGDQAYERVHQSFGRELVWKENLAFFNHLLDS